MKSQLLFLLVFIFVLKSQISSATTYTWTGSTNSNWSTNGNWSPSTGHPVAGDIVNIGATTNKPTVDVNSACASITITGTTTLTLAASLTISGALQINSSISLTIPAGSNQTLSAGGATTLNAASSQFIIGSGNNVNFSSLTVGSSCTLSNSGALTVSANVTINPASAAISNASTGTFNIAGQLSLGSSCNITNNGNFSVTGAITLNAASAYISNSSTGTFKTSNNIAFGSSCYITNSGVFDSSAGTFTFAASSSGINNLAGGTFYLYNNSTVNFGSSTFLTNAGVFYAGKSNSACTLNLAASSSEYISNTGTFYLGSTSVINLTGYSTSVTNTSPGVFTLQSDQYGSATIGAVPTGTGVFVGTFNVQRFVTGGSGYRGYRLLSSPVYGSTDAHSNKIFSVNYLENTLYLTGTTGTSGGFDKAGNPTIYFYRENIAYSNATFISGNCRGLNTIGTAPNYNYLIDGDAGTFNIAVGNGLLFFFRGDRSQATLAAETTTTYVPTNATLTATGTLIQQQVVVHDWYTPSSANLGWTNTTGNSLVQGYNLVGNPYASSIDWEQYNTSTTTSGIYASNIGTTIYELNPATGNYDTYQKGGAHTNQGSNIIASGQAFFVRASNNSSPQLIFNESAKTNTLNTGVSLFMSTRASVVTVSDPYLRVQLAKDSVNTDDVYISFNSAAKTAYSPDVDAAYKTGSGKVSLSSLSSDNMALAIYKLPLPKQSQTIRLNVSAASDGIYKLNLTELNAIPSLYEVWLMDSYKKDSLDLRHNSTYNFNLALSDAGTYGANRFSVVIRQNPALGLHLLNFTAVRALGGVQVNWQTENEQNTTNFTVERSTDKGTAFNAIGGFLSDAQGTYGFLDQNPLMASGATDEYRLKLVDLNGTITYSKIATLGYSNLTSALAANNIIVYPNPASGTVHITLSDQLGAGLSTRLSLNATQASNTVKSNTSSYTIRIVNIMGAVLKTAVSPQPNWQDDVSSLLPGTYFIQVTNNANKSLVGRSSFVKL
jgi:hypothetical protein